MIDHQKTNTLPTLLRMIGAIPLTTTLSAAALCCLAGSVVGCSAGLFREENATTVDLNKLFLGSLTYRKPTDIPDTPTLQSEQINPLTCQALDNFFPDYIPNWNIQAAQACLQTWVKPTPLAKPGQPKKKSAGKQSKKSAPKTLTDSDVLEWQFQFEPSPSWQLLPPPKEKKIPACVTTFFGTLPVPQAILYQSIASNPLPGAPSPAPVTCFQSTLDAHSHSLLAFLTQNSRNNLKLNRKMLTVPEERTQFLFMLETWLIFPLIGDLTEAWSATIVPQTLCQPCIGATRFIKPEEPAPLLWPLERPKLALPVEAPEP